MLFKKHITCPINADGSGIILKTKTSVEEAIEKTNPKGAEGTRKDSTTSETTVDTDFGNGSNIDKEAVSKIKNWGGIAKDDNYQAGYTGGCDVIGAEILDFLDNLFFIIQVIAIILFL